jgi:hypothetical protein
MPKKCCFRKKDGSGCAAQAQSGKDLCIFHDPTRANDGRRARRAGGLNRTRTAVVLASDTPDHSLGSADDVSVLLSDSINRLRRGQLDPRVGNAMGYLASVLLRALEQGPIIGDRNQHRLWKTVECSRRPTGDLLLCPV